MDDYDQDYTDEIPMNDYNLSYDQGYEDAKFGEDEKATTNADYQSGYIDGLRAREEQEAEETESTDESMDNFTDDISMDDDTPDDVSIDNVID